MVLVAAAICLVFGFVLVASSNACDKPNRANLEKQLQMWKDQLAQSEQLAAESAFPVLAPLCLKRRCPQQWKDAERKQEVQDLFHKIWLDYVAKDKDQIAKLEKLLADPPQPSYMQLPKVELPGPVSITTTSRSLRPVARAATALIQSESEYVALLAAITQGLERAQGANDAGDHRWTAKQMRAATSLARFASDLLHRQAALRATLAVATKASKMQYRFSAAAIRALQARVRRHGLPPALRKALTELGWSRADLEEMRRDILQGPARAIDEVGMLRDPAWAQANAAMSDALRAWAQDMEPLGSLGLCQPPPSHFTGTATVEYSTDNGGHVTHSFTLTYTQAPSAPSRSPLTYWLTAATDTVNYDVPGDGNCSEDSGTGAGVLSFDSAGGQPQELVFWPEEGNIYGYAIQFGAGGWLPLVDTTCGLPQPHPGWVQAWVDTESTPEEHKTASLSDIAATGSGVTWHLQAG